MKLSIVMPVFNEESTLAEIVGRVQATAWDKELILVNDGSRDRSREIMDELAKKYGNIRCFHHDVNRAGARWSAMCGQACCHSTN